MEQGKIIDVIDMPSMADGKKNKKQVNGSQVFNEISRHLKDNKPENVKVIIEHVYSNARPRCY